MNFLRTLFWIAVTVVVVVFSVRNWSPVTINLFGDLQADVKLPVLLLLAFLLGFVPVYIWHKALRWNDRRQAARPALPLPEPAPTPYTQPFPAPPSPIEGAGIGPARAD